MTCSLCGGPITHENERSAYRQIVAWAKPGKSGKPSATLVDKRETGAFAHSECILKVKMGMHVEQEALFE